MTTQPAQNDNIRGGPSQADATPLAPLSLNTRPLADLILRHTAGDGIHNSKVPHLDLIRQGTVGAPIPVVYEPSLVLIVQGRKRVMLNQQTFVFDAAQYLAASLALPMIGEVLEATPQTPYLSLQLFLDPARLASLLSELPGEAPQPRPSQLGLSLTRVTPRLLDTVTRLMALLDTPEDIPVLAPMIERELLYHALKDGQLPLLHQIALDGSPAQGLSRALNWLRAHYTEPFSMARLADEARMSESALYAHFRTVTSMSPLQYQKQLRLGEARRLLTGQHLAAASAGHAVGYESPSQFSREYRRQFGTTPAQDRG